MKNYKIYKAFVTDKETNETRFIEFESRTKKAALEDIRRNGYKVSNTRCKEKEVFNWIVDHDIYDDPIEHEAHWRISKIPADMDEYDELFNKNVAKVKSEKYRKGFRR